MSRRTRPTVADMRLRLAAALLIQDGEVSMDQIEALPCVEERGIAELLAQELMRRLGADRFQRRVEGRGITTWEDVLRLTEQDRVAGSPNERVNPTAGGLRSRWGAAPRSLAAGYAQR